MVSTKDILAEMMEEMMEESASKAEMMAAMFTQSVNTDLLMAILALISKQIGEEFGLGLIEQILKANLLSAMQHEKFKDVQEELHFLVNDIQGTYSSTFRQYHAHFSKANAGTS